MGFDLFCDKRSCPVGTGHGLFCPQQGIMLHVFFAFNTALVINKMGFNLFCVKGINEEQNRPRPVPT